MTDPAAPTLAAPAEPGAPAGGDGEVTAGPAPGAAAEPGTPRSGRTRGRPPSRFAGIRNPIPLGWQIAFGTAGIAVVFVLWVLASARLGTSGASIVPSPVSTFAALGKLWEDGTFRDDLLVSLRRIGLGYSISVALGVVFGMALGTFPSVQAFLEAQFGFLRYIPATALTPLFMFWLGIGESPKVWLITVGTVFFNILMIADVARAVPRELINVSYTLGAGRARIMRKVLLPHSLPGIIDVSRINLAAAWLMLIVAELLASQNGLAYEINVAQRFRQVDRIFALLIVFGVIGLVSDLTLRVLRDLVAPWNRA